MTSPSPASAKSLHMDVGALSWYISISGTQRWAFGQCFYFSACFRAHLEWCEEDSSKTSWFLILCPDCAPSHLLSSQRSKALCVWLNSSPHYPSPTLIHWLGLLFGLRSLPFILRAKYQYCSHCSKCSESKVALAILSEYAVHFLKFLQFTLTLFHIWKNTYTFPLGGRYPLILQEIETVPLGTAS